MAQGSIGREQFGFAGRDRAASSLDALVSLIDWVRSRNYSIRAIRPPLAMFRALLLSIWYDLSNVKLAEELGDRASFHRFCGFTDLLHCNEPDACRELSANHSATAEMTLHQVRRSVRAAG